jgi:hypothetical protein
MGSSDAYGLSNAKWGFRDDSPRWPPKTGHRWPPDEMEDPEVLEKAFAGGRPTASGKHLLGAGHLE